PSRLPQALRWVQGHRVAALVVGLLIIQGAVLVGWFSRQNDALKVDQQSDIKPEPPSDPKAPSNTNADSPPPRDMAAGDVRRELFDGRTLRGWRIENGMFQADTAPDIGPVMTFQGRANCVFVDADDEVLKDYRLQLTVYPHETDVMSVTFG